MADTYERMRQLIGSDADWGGNDLVIGDGEIAFGRVGGAITMKVGDGASTYSALATQFDPPAGLPVGTNSQTLRYGATSWEATSALVVSDGGNVGIGTTVPAVNLDVRGNSAGNGVFDLRSGGASANNARINFGDLNTQRMGRINYACATDNMTFETVATERMRIDAAGNVGIGTTAPNNPLEVVVGDGGRLAINSGTNAGDEKVGLQFYLRNVSNVPTDVGSIDVGRVGTDAGSFFMAFSGLAGAERMRIDSSGNLLVGKTTGGIATEGVELKSTGQVNITRSASAPLTVNRIGAAGNIQNWQTAGSTVASVASDGTYTGPISSAAYKENIEDSTLGLDNILKIPVRSFKYKTSDKVYEAGFITEELREAVPQAVDGDARSDSNLVPVLVKAIQELTARVEQLEGQLNA